MATEAQRRAVAKYDKHNTRQYSFKVNLNTDADIEAVLQSVGNVQGYIKALIRQDMARTSNKLVTDGAEGTVK